MTLYSLPRAVNRGPTQNGCWNVSDEEIREIKVNAVPKSTQNGTKYGVRLFKGKSTSSAQAEFTTEFESMEMTEMNNCLSKFYLSARKQDGSHYKKTSLLSIRAALDRCQYLVLLPRLPSR